MELPFDRSVFINCPFDSKYAPILQAVAFCVIDLGFHARLAPENANNAANRLDRIIELIRGSKYAIHDLSRCRSGAAGEYSRMNMPFELGIDHGCQRYGAEGLQSKSILILEDTKYDYQKALSDIAGWDIESHTADHIKAVRHVRNWLVKQANAEPIGSNLVLNHYDDFQKWYWGREQERGASDDDIKAYPTILMIDAMREWFDAGRPA